MNKDELKTYIDHLGDNCEIIVVTTKEQSNVIPKRCERIDISGKAVYLLRKCVDGVWFAFVVWVVQAVELVPKPHIVYLAASEKIDYVVKHADWCFPFTKHENQYPHLSFELNGTTHYVPTSALLAEVLEYTGCYIVEKNNV